MSDHLVMVNLKIGEFLDGHKVNECVLFTDGDRDYLSLCQRILDALAPDHIGTTVNASDSTDQGQL